MNRIDEISIIIPVFNEEKRVRPCLKKILEYCKNQCNDFEIIFAEDGSDDNTVNIINEFQEAEPRIKLISIKERVGKGGAIKNAMLQADKKIVAFMDVDLAVEPSELSRLSEYIQQYEIVIGSRILRGDLPPISKPIQRAVFSWLYSKFFRVLFRIPIYDPQCGFKLFQKSIVTKLFNEIKTTRFAFDSEIVVKAYSMEISIKEAPVNWSHDSASKISVIKQVKEMSQDLLSVWYESHLLWLQNKKVYPQKKGSLKARALFGFLSLYKKPRQS